MDYVIRAVGASEAVTDSPSWLHEGAAEVIAEFQRELHGVDDLAPTAAELAVNLVPKRHVRRELLVAVAGSAERPDSVVGVLQMGLPLLDNRYRADAVVTVRRDWRRHGVGGALWQSCLEILDAEERTVAQAFTEHNREPEDGEESALTPRTGSGLLPGGDDAARFAARCGFELEQVERHSVIELPVAEQVLGSLGLAAEQAAGGEYRLVGWVGAAPDDLVPGLCRVAVAMSEDMPHGELEIEAMVWDAQRWRDGEASRAAAGRAVSTVAAVHRKTGDVVGYTEVAVLVDKPSVGYQDDTIVVQGHRGRRLGMLLKVANLRQLGREFPRLRRIHTWNAEENGPMLDINVALGFAPAGVEGVWQRRG